MANKVILKSMIWANKSKSFLFPTDFAIGHKTITDDYLKIISYFLQFNNRHIPKNRQVKPIITASQSIHFNN